jgi:2-amino-4-hydroxy-6-hydroxymethyldihydropteridine diphosphokinase
MDNIFLLLGTNLGNLKKNLHTALNELHRNNIRIIKKSSIYRTKPWGYDNQPDFLNMAIEVDCCYAPEELLRILKSIESSMGRKTMDDKWKARIIDIDILFFGDRIVHSPRLTIPHKEFYNRPFAIHLLAEISPDFMPPHSKKSVKELKQETSNEGIEIYRN